MAITKTFRLKPGELQLSIHQLGLSLCSCTGNKRKVCKKLNAQPWMEMGILTSIVHTFLFLPANITPLPMVSSCIEDLLVIEFQPQFYGECNGVNFSNASSSWKESLVAT